MLEQTKKIEVLDKGFVELLDVMGSDLTVVNAARVSFGKQKEVFDESDEKLIKYLAKYGHWTPFSQCQLQFRIRMPIFTARQYFKHTVGLTRNEISRRYVKDAPEFHLPKEWRLAAENVKQGSSSEISENSEDLSKIVDEFYKKSEELYNLLLSKNICPEQARMVLSQAMYTEFIETGSLAAYARINSLRVEKTAQLETREYPLAQEQLIEPIFPISWKALTKKI